MALDDELETALKGNVQEALKQAGEVLKKDLWKPEDAAYLAARAEDLVGLNRKAQAATDPNKKGAYRAAALDTLQGAKMLALIRAEAASAQLTEQLGQLFMKTVLPQLIKFLPTIIAAL